MGMLVGSLERSERVFFFSELQPLESEEPTDRGRLSWWFATALPRKKTKTNMTGWIFSL